MMLAPLLVAVALGQSAPYVRSHVDPQNKDTQCLYWTAERITWQQSSVGNPATSADTEFAAVRSSFQSWQNIFAQCGNLALVEGPVVDDRQVGYEQEGSNRNLVLFRTRSCDSTQVVPADAACRKDDTCANAFDCWEHGNGTIGITLTTYDERSGIIYDSDIELNAVAFRFTTADRGGTCGPVSTTDCVSTDVQNTVTHEVGHLLGLDHTEAPGSTMNPSAPPGETAKRTIDQGSSSFVCEAYPKGRASQACIYVPPDEDVGKKGLNCASAGAEAWLPALLGWALLAVRRRRDGSRA